MESCKFETTVPENGIIQIPELPGLPIIILDIAFERESNGRMPTCDLNE
jgi:hypothetical protein